MSHSNSNHPFVKNNKKSNRRKSSVRDPYIAPLMKMVPGNYRNIIEPPETDRTLIYPFCFTLGSAATVSRRFNPNAVYDVDPTLGSTSVPGFAELAQLYNFYRVVHTSYRVEIANTDALPIVGYVYLSNSDPGTSLPYANALANPLGVWKTLSAGGGGKDTLTLKDSQTVATILGSNEVEVGEQYRALVTAVPADLLWLTVGVHSISGTALTANAVNVVVAIKMVTRFFDRITALASFSSLSQVEKHQFMIEREKQVRCSPAVPRDELKRLKEAKLEAEKNFQSVCL
jgi:hypothetical protein